MCLTRKIGQVTFKNVTAVLTVFLFATIPSENSRTGAGRVLWTLSLCLCPHQTDCCGFRGDHFDGRDASLVGRAFPARDKARSSTAQPYRRIESCVTLDRSEFNLIRS
jgi:hypothetical protein